MVKQKRTSREEAWQTHYKLLKQFVAREGHSRVPARHEENGFRLGRWVHAQRQNRERLDESRRKALERLKDWNWAGQDAKWERGHAVLLQFIKREGHALVPKPYREADFALGVWVMHQRAAYRKGRLSEERIERLDRVPGWAWYPREIDKSAEYASSSERLPRHIADASIDELTEEVWKILFGLGAVTRAEALELVASELHKKGLVRSRTSKPGTRTGDLLYDVLKTAVDYGYLDIPTPDHFRAVLNNAEDYEPSDWRMCLFNSIEDESSIGREEAIAKAAKWAKENLALEYGRLKKNGAIWKQLDQAIETAIRNKEIKQTVFYGVEKIKSLI